MICGCPCRSPGVGTLATLTHEQRLLPRGDEAHGHNLNPTLSWPDRAPGGHRGGLELGWRVDRRLQMQLLAVATIDTRTSMSPYRNSRAHAGSSQDARGRGS